MYLISVSQTVDSSIDTASGTLTKILQVMVVEEDNEGRAVDRARVSPLTNSYLFTGLIPGREYHAGVVAFVDHEPAMVYKMLVKTAQSAPANWDETPRMAIKNAQQFSVHWKKPKLTERTAKFVVEYRLPNETE